MCHTVYDALECRHYNKNKFTGEQSFRKCQRALIQRKYPERCMPEWECAQTFNTLYKLFVCMEYHNEMNQRWEQDLLLLIKEGDDTYSYWYETGGPTNCSVSRL
jgi:hypothetical protein